MSQNGQSMLKASDGDLEPPGGLRHGLIAGHRGFQVAAVVRPVAVVVAHPLDHLLIECGGGQVALVLRAELSPGGAIEPRHLTIELGRAGRQNPKFDAVGLTGRRKAGHELAATIHLNGAHPERQLPQQMVGAVAIVGVACLGGVTERSGAYWGCGALPEPPPPTCSPAGCALVSQTPPQGGSN